MSKQWGHGFHCGKMAIISDLLRGITLPDGFHKAVYLRQSGGKYCVFECPVCHEDRALFKMTANSGWCNNCRADFQNFSAVHELTPLTVLSILTLLGLLRCTTGVKQHDPPHWAPDDRDNDFLF